jgi:CubicO group peptidase (beta-lactamase class C family)
MRRYDVPGISVAVIHEGKIAWARGWGLRDLESCAPVTPTPPSRPPPSAR